MTALVARLAHDVRDGDLFRAERPSRRERAVAVRVSSREEAAARRRAARVCGVKAFHPKTCRGHLVEHGRFDVGMAVVAGLLPAVVVAHQKNDIRRRGDGKRWTEEPDEYGVN